MGFYISDKTEDIVFRILFLTNDFYTPATDTKRVSLPSLG